MQSPHFNNINNKFNTDHLLNQQSNSLTTPSAISNGIMAYNAIGNPMANSAGWNASVSPLIATENTVTAQHHLYGMAHEYWTALSSNAFTNQQYYAQNNIRNNALPVQGANNKENILDGGERPLFGDITNMVQKVAMPTKKFDSEQEEKKYLERRNRNT